MRHRVVNTADKPRGTLLLQIEFRAQRMCTWSENLIVRHKKYNYRMRLSRSVLYCCKCS